LRIAIWVQLSYCEHICSKEVDKKDASVQSRDPITDTKHTEATQ
jgi:hypothetical protein